MIKSRTIAIAGSIAALSLAAVPIAQAAGAPHTQVPARHVDRSPDAHGVRHLDKSPDRTPSDHSRDARDR